MDVALFGIIKKIKTTVNNIKSDINKLSEKVTDGVSWNELKDKPFYLEKTLFLQLTKDDFGVDEDGYLLYTSTPKLDWLVSSDNVGLYISVVENDGNSYVSTENSPDYYFEKGQNDDGTEYVSLEGDRYYIDSGFDDRFSIKIYTNYEDTKEINLKLYRIDVKKIPGICVDAPIGKTALTIKGELYDEATDDNIPVIIPQIEIPIESSYVSGSYIFYDMEQSVLRTSKEVMPWKGTCNINLELKLSNVVGNVMEFSLKEGDAAWEYLDHSGINFTEIVFCFTKSNSTMLSFMVKGLGSRTVSALAASEYGNVYCLLYTYSTDYKTINGTIRCII